MVETNQKEVEGKVVSKTEMPTTNFDEVLDRLKTASDVKTDYAFAAVLGIQKQSVQAAKKRQIIPPGWILQIGNSFGYSLDWLQFGTGPMRRDEEVGDRQTDVAQLPSPTVAAPILPRPQPETQAQGFRISDALAMTARVLESGTTYATALYLNIQHFDRAIQAEGRIQQLEQNLAALDTKMAIMEKQLTRLIHENAEMRKRPDLQHQAEAPQQECA